MKLALAQRWFTGLRAATCLALLCATMTCHALQIKDERGVEVTFAQSPQRIVSLLPSLTEMVCALGQCARLVGVDRYSNYPTRVAGLPKVGGGIDPNIESIVALKPDVVLMAVSAQGAARLQALGLKVVTLEPQTHADVRRVLQQLGQLLEVPDALRVWQDIDAAMNAAARSLPASARFAHVYFEVNSAPYAASESSFIGETLKRLGVNNIVPAGMGPFPKINPEFVVRANPDIIMVGDRPDMPLDRRPGWSGLRALREKRVCIFSPDQSDMLVRPGPRMAEGARLMARCLNDKLSDKLKAGAP